MPREISDYNHIPSMEEIREKYLEVTDNIESAKLRSGRNDDIKLIAVSKTHPSIILENAYLAGIRVFGESYAQEYRDKYYEMLNKGIKDIEWHFIGHLQRNKVKYLANDVTFIHSVDSIRLAEEINKEAEKAGRIIDVTLEVNTSGERSKFGCSPEELDGITSEVMNYNNISVRGLMTIGSFSDDERIVREEFTLLRNLMANLQRNYPDRQIDHLSMGMTNDYQIAVEEGATMLRVGTAIFGERIYG